MGDTRVRVVVGEGDSPRRGLLRFVLEGDGYDVVGEGSTPAQLARLVADHRPDVVVLDDTIGATAPQVVREISPRSRIVLVWPGAVVPIGGDARVEPAQVLRQLGPTVAKVAAGVAGFTTIERPDWVEKVRKDPATLRERLERSGGLPKRPSVTELQRRGQRLQPASPGADEVTDDDRDEVAPVLPLATAAGAAALAGVAAGAGADEASEAVIELPDAEQGSAVLHLPDEQAGGAVVVPLAAAARGADPSATEMNRRLGTIALGGAAVVGAVVFALALGGSRVSTDIIVAEGPRATIAPGPPIDSGIDEPEPDPDQDPGGRPDGDRPELPPDLTPAEWPYTGGGGDGGDPTGGGERPPTVPDDALEPPPSIPDGGGSEPPPTVPIAPGRSVLSNPHGVPPGQTSDGPHDTEQPGDHPHGGAPGLTSVHPQGGPPGQTGQHPHGGPPGTMP